MLPIDDEEITTTTVDSGLINHNPISQSVAGHTVHPHYEDTHHQSAGGYAELHRASSVSFPTGKVKGKSRLFLFGQWLDANEHLAGAAQWRQFELSLEVDGIVFRHGYAQFPNVETGTNADGDCVHR